MKIYISGPLSNRTQAEKAFSEAKRICRLNGHEPYCPFDDMLPLSSTWRDHMRVNIVKLLDADVILMLYDWGRFRSCRIEHSIASELGIPVLTNFSSIEMLKSRVDSFCVEPKDRKEETTALSERESAPEKKSPITSFLAKLNNNFNR